MIDKILTWALVVLGILFILGASIGLGGELFFFGLTSFVLAYAYKTYLSD